MSENKQDGTQPSGCSSEMLQLRAHNIRILVSKIGIISNEIQALGSILESLGAAITLYGNLIGAGGFKMETIATELHITSVLQELQGQKGESKSNLLLQLKAYDILLTANSLGTMSNEIQAFGAVIQTAAGAIIAYGNLLTVAAFELDIKATRLQIISVLQELEKQRNQSKSDSPKKEDKLNTSELVDASPQGQLEQLYQKMHQMQNKIDQQQTQILEIQKVLSGFKENT